MWPTISRVAACKNSAAATFEGLSGDVSARLAALGSIASSHTVSLTADPFAPPLTVRSSETLARGSQSAAESSYALLPSPSSTRACAAPPILPRSLATLTSTPPPSPVSPLSISSSAALARRAAMRLARYNAAAVSSPSVDAASPAPSLKGKRESMTDLSTYGFSAPTTKGKSASISRLSSCVACAAPAVHRVSSRSSAAEASGG